MKISEFGTARASFDLTDFGSKSRFVTFLREAGLTQNEEYDGDGWEWLGLGEEVALHTYNNPITGEYYHSDIRRIQEQGYASYMHILGSQNRVDEVYELIEEMATYVKDSSKNAWIV
jgi:superoxide dismutase